MADNLVSTTIRLNDAFSATLNKLASGVNKSQSVFGALKSSLSGNIFGSAEKSSGGFLGNLSTGVVVGNLVTGALGKIKDMAGEVAGGLDATTTSWKTFEGNMAFLGQSNKQIMATEKSLQDYAQKTIYSASDMASTYSQMKAVGVKNTQELVKGFGGLAASAENPAQAMKSLSQQATQMAAKPKVQWEDFKIMLEQAPGGMSAVAKAMGMTTKQLVSNVQSGKVQTQELFDAMAKAGNNPYFTKMATQFKTIGDATDGLMDTLTYNLRKPWEAISKFGINAINGLSDTLSKIDYSKLATDITSVLTKAQTFISNFATTAKKDLGEMFAGFKSTGALKDIQSAFDTIKTSLGQFSKSAGKAGGTSFFTDLGKVSGTVISNIADALAGLAKAVGKLNPQTIQNIALAFAVLKGGVKGLVLTGIVKAMQLLGDLDADTLNNIANSITAIAVAVALFKALKTAADVITSVKTALSSFKAPAAESIGAGQAPAIIANAQAYMQLGAAFAFVGVGALAIAGAFLLIVQAATNLANAGISAQLGFVLLVSLLGVLIVGLTMLAPALTAGSAGLIALGFALLSVGAAVLLTAVGIYILSAALPAIASYGLSAAVGLIALAAAVGLLGIGALVAGAGLLVLAVAIAAVAVTFVLFGISAIVAGAGLLVLSVALAVVAVEVAIFAASLLVIAISLTTIAIAATVLGATIIAVVFAVGATIVQVISTVAAGISIVLTTLGSTISAIVRAIATGITTVIKGVGDTIKGIIDSISTGISNVFNSIANVINSVGNSIRNAGLGLQGIATGLREIASIGLGKTIAMLTSLAVGLGKVSSEGTGLANAGRGMLTLASGAMMAASALNALKSVRQIQIKPPTVNFSSTISSVHAGMAAAVAAVISHRAALISAVRSSVQDAISAGRSAASAMHSVGVMIGAGLAAGMRSEVGAAAAAANALVDQANRAARAKAKIHSPSRLFAEVGDYIGQGLAVGMDSTQSLVANSAEGLINSASLASKASPGPSFGGSLADGFYTAYDAIMQVVEALTSLDGTTATVGVKGKQFASLATPTQQITSPVNTAQAVVTSQPISSPAVTSASITPASSVNNTFAKTQNSRQTVVNVQAGAIAVNGAQQPQKSAEEILSAIEDILDAKEGGALSW